MTLIPSQDLRLYCDDYSYIGSFLFRQRNALECHGNHKSTNRKKLFFDKERASSWITGPVDRVGSQESPFRG